MGGTKLNIFRETKVRFEDVSPNLWNGHVDALSYDAHGEKYQSAILEQYKLYVEMADRVSARRALANTFFLTLNTAVFTAIGVSWKDPPKASPWLLAFPLVVCSASAWPGSGSYGPTAS